MDIDISMIPILQEPTGAIDAPVAPIIMEPATEYHGPSSKVQALIQNLRRDSFDKASGWPAKRYYHITLSAISDSLLTTE